MQLEMARGNQPGRHEWYSIGVLFCFVSTCSYLDMWTTRRFCNFLEVYITRIAPININHVRLERQKEKKKRKKKKA